MYVYIDAATQLPYNFLLLPEFLLVQQEAYVSEEFNNEMGKGDVTDDDKLWGALSLALPIIGIIALLMEDKKERPFIKHAAVNAVAMAIAIFVLTFILGLIPVVNCVTAPIGLVLWGYSLYLAWQTYNGEWVVIPGVTDFVKGQGWL